MRSERYWVKMRINGGVDSWIMRCDHIGQAKFFGYILATYNPRDGIWSSTKTKRATAMLLLEIAESTLLKYLQTLTRAGLLVKLGRGDYKVNSKYVGYGKDEP